MSGMNGTERQDAVAAWLAASAAGEEMTGTQLAERFGRSARWGRDRIAEARAGAGDLQVAAPPPRGFERHAAASERHEGGTAPSRSWLDSAVTLAVALVAAAASYGHMYDVALMAGESVWIARAWPITVDGLAVAALRRGDSGRGWLLLALAVSVASNVLAQFPGTVAQVAPAVSAWPPLALYGTHRLLHTRR